MELQTRERDEVGVHTPELPPPHLAGRGASFVSKFERGERRLDLIEFIDVARALGVDPHYLIRELERS